MRAMGRSEPSSESRTRRRCCRSPKTICEVRVLAFSFSLCCTRSERRIVLVALRAHSFPRSPGIVRKRVCRVGSGQRHKAIPPANADYVPRAAHRKVTNVLRVPDVQPSLFEDSKLILYGESRGVGRRVQTQRCE